MSYGIEKYRIIDEGRWKSKLNGNLTEGSILIENPIQEFEEKLSKIDFLKAKEAE